MTAPWHDGTLVGFDLETTSPDPLTARVVSASVITDYADGTREVDRWIVDPGIPVPDDAAAVHGITTERARAEGIPAARAIPQIVGALDRATSFGIPVVVYNGTYDLSTIDREAIRNRTPRPDHRLALIDPLVLDRHLDPSPKEKRRRILSLNAEHYGISLLDAHDAAADAYAAIEIARAVGRRYPEVGNVPVKELVRLQEQWYRENAATLTARYRHERSNPDFTIPPEFGFRPVTPEEGLIDLRGDLFAHRGAPSPRRAASRCAEGRCRRRTLDPTGRCHLHGGSRAGRRLARR